MHRRIQEPFPSYHNVKPYEHAPAKAVLGGDGATLPAMAKPRVLAAETERGRERGRTPLSGRVGTRFYPTRGVSPVLLLESPNIQMNPCLPGPR